MNQAISIFWEVWKNSGTFKTHVMKEIYVAVNKKPIKNFSEIIILDY